MVQQQMGETNRRNLADEALKSRALDQNDEVRQSLASLREAQTAGLKTAAGERVREQTNAADMLGDPQVPDAVKTFIRLRSSVPKGENVPWEVTNPKPMTGAEAGSIEESPTGMVRVSPTNQVTPILDKAGKPVQKYHPPQAPPVQLVQSGDSWLRVDKRTGTATPLTASGGGPVPLATTSSTRTMGEGAKMLLPHIDALSKEAEELDKAGLFGPAMSRIRQIAEHVGSIDDFFGAVESDPQLTQLDPKVGHFATSLGLLATGAGRVHGGARGGGSPQMFQHFKAMLSDTGTVGLFKGRLSAVNDYMGGYAAGPNGTPFPQNQSQSDPMGILGLPRPKV
jgi:hypothetical protein